MNMQAEVFRPNLGPRVLRMGLIRFRGQVSYVASSVRRSSL